jgi:malonyl-CoA O-methyltransferase
MGATGVGVDICYPMLRRAGLKPSLSGGVVQADCLQLPIRSNSIDFAILAFALSHLDAIDKFFLEISRVSVPGGTLVVSDLHPEAYARGWRTGFEDEEGAALILSQHHSVEKMESAARASGILLRSRADLCLGASEKPLFEVRGELERYSRVRGCLAVLVLQFERSE